MCAVVGSTVNGLSSKEQMLSLSVLLAILMLILVALRIWEMEAKWENIIEGSDRDAAVVVNL